MITTLKTICYTKGEAINASLFIGDKQMTNHNHHIGHGLDELDQLNDILYDLYVDDQAEARYEIKGADSQVVTFNTKTHIDMRISR